MGQRLESLAALTEAARIRPDTVLRDNAIAAMALPDIEHGPAFPAWSAGARALTHDPRNRHLARIGLDGVISIRGISDNHELQQLTPRSGITPATTVRQFTFSPDGRFLVWLDTSDQLELWRWKRGETVLMNPPGHCPTVAFGPDGRRVAVGHEDWISCFHLDTGGESRRWRARDQVHALDFNPDSRRLAVGYLRNDAVSIHDADQGEPLAGLSTETSSRNIVAWHPDGQLLASGGSDARILVWDVARGREVAWLRMNDTTAALFRADGRELLTCGPANGLQRWRIETPGESDDGWLVGPARRILLPFAPMRMVKGGDDQTISVVGEAAGQCVSLDLVTETAGSTRMAHAAAAFVAVSPDGSRLAPSGWHSTRAKLWDVSDGRLIQKWEVGSSSRVFVTPDDRELIVAQSGEFTRRGHAAGHRAR